MSDIFISYSHQDKEAAKKLRSMLTPNWDVWMDDGIPNGTYWRREIDKELDAAALTVVLISPDSMKSAYVTYEWCYKWFKWDKDLNDLYFIVLRECRNEEEGMFGRIYSDLEVKPRIVFDDAGWNDAVNEIDSRLHIFKEMRKHRDNLAPRGKGEVFERAAISYLGNVTNFRRKACEYLIESMQAHYTGMGTNVAAIADALAHVGDLRAIPCLLDVPTRTTYPDAVSKAQNAIREICRRGV